MLALNKIASAPGAVAVGQTDPREPWNDEVMIRVHASGLCGTDMQIYRGTGGIARRVKPPMVLGHEACGKVVKVGAGVTRVAVGDVVSLESHIPCWTCKACRTGRAHVCMKTLYPGIDIPGTFAEYVTVPASICWINPPDVNMEHAALLEPLGIAVHASLEGSGVSGQVVVVNGCGPIGLMNVAAAKIFGAHKVIGIDPNAKRRGTAERLGADAVIDPTQGSVPEQVRALTSGEGADVVIEYTGNAEGVRNCFSMVAPLGQVRWCGTPYAPVEFDFALWRIGRPVITVINGRRIWETWEKAAPLVYEKRFDLDCIASHRLPLSEGLRAFELIEAGEAVKPLLMCA